MSDLPGSTEPPVEPLGEPAPRARARSQSGLGRASALLASGTLVSRLLGFVKLLVLVGTIGQVYQPSNAFAVANQLPNNIYAIIAGGLLGAVLVPQIVKAGAHDDGGQRFINKIVTLGGSAFLLIAIAATAAAPLLISLYASTGSDSGRGFSPEGIALATLFAYWCLPQVLFYALYSLLGEVLNARKAFGAFTWAPVVNNVVAIAGLVAFGLIYGGPEANSQLGTWDAGRIALLAGSATLGVAAQALVVAAFWRRTGLGFRPDFRWKGVGLRRVGTAAGWTFAMILVTQIAGVVQTRVASQAADGNASVAVLQSSWLIFMLPHSVIAVSIATAYFTRMSGHATSGDLDGVRDDVSSSLRNIGAFITLASVGLVVVAFPFARVFEESDFVNVQAMAFVVIAFVVGLVPFSAVFVMQRAFFALEDTRTPFFIETAKAATFVLGAIGCSFLPVEWIAAGIALVTTAACLVQTVLTFLLLRRRLGPIGGRLIVRRYAQFGLAAFVALLIGSAVLVAVGGLTPDGFAQSGRVAAILAIVVIGAVMTAVYLGTLVLIRNPEAKGAVDAVAARLRRR